MDQAPRDRLRQQDYGHRFSSKRGMKLNIKKKSSDLFDNVTSIKSHEALHQQRSLHEEKLVQQQWDA